MGKADAGGALKDEASPRSGTDLRAGLGREGERQARAFLERLGYRILALQWRCRLGEIDIIARDGETTVFVEVRTRSDRRHGAPQETVRPAKQQRLTRLAGVWLASRSGCPTTACRFDVVAISPDPATGRTEVVHLKDAFRGGR